jgi:hypothetical protein
VNPEIEVVRADVRPEVAKLLLAGTPDFLQVMKVLLDCRPVGECFQDLGEPI